MITKFKIYESINEGDPEVGDYVVIYGDYFANELIEFFKNNIGKIIGKNNLEYPYCIEFDNIVPSDGPSSKSKTFNVTEDEIKYWSKNIDFIKSADDVIKFNL